MTELLKLPRKILVISSYSPPKINGGSKYLFNILSNFTPDSYCFLTSYKNFNNETSDASYSLPCHYYFYDRLPRNKKTPGRFRVILTKPFRVFFMIYEGLKLIRREHIELLVGTTGQGQILLLTYLLSRLSGVPYCPWMVDLWRENNLSAGWKRIADYFEPILFKGAVLIFVSCPAIREHLQLQYPSLNKFHTINVSGFNEAHGPTKVKVKDNSNITLLFSGSIYWAQEDAVDEIVEACQELEGTKVSLVFYVPNRTDRLVRKYSKMKSVEVRSAKKSEMLMALSGADILLIPLSWQTRNNVVINTAIPTKLIDYLVSGRPILIYAPKESYVSEYGRTHGFACVVDEQNKDAIKSAIRKITSDEEYVFELVKNAKKTFYKNHNAQTNSKTFYDSLSGL